VLIIDAQVHAYERDRPERPWAAVLAGPAEVMGDAMVAAMDAAGVDGALLVSPWTMYRYDASYALAVHAAHPDRFALIKPVDPDDPGSADTVAEWAGTGGAVAVRIMMADKYAERVDDGGVGRILAAAAGHSFPVNLLCWGRLELVERYAAAHPNTRLVIDHLGLRQPFTPPAPPDPFAELPKLLRLAAHDNVVVKITGACTLSRQAFPYDDIWPHLEMIFEAFGIDRCMWGTDWTRAVNLLSYEQGVDAFRETDRLSDDERARLMGGTLANVYGWSPAGRAK